MSRRWLLRVVMSVLGAAVVWGVLDFWRFMDHPSPAPLLVDIGKGGSVARIADTLAQKEVVSSAHWFMLLAYVERVRKKSIIQAGEYLFPQGETPRLVLERLTTGTVVLHRLVIPEGMTVAEIGGRMQEHGWAGVPALLADPGVITQLELDAPSLEGWLFPSTYYYRRGDSALSLLTRMTKQARHVLDEQWGGNHQNSVQSGAARPLHNNTLSRFEILILASIVEKETGQEQERGRVAAVFHNRLRKKMRLQSDPTVIYGLLNSTDGLGYDGNLTKKHLHQPTPYNTYVQMGLPPTPICNPGKAAVRAAAHPDDNEDLFFVARGDGTHLFSKTLAEHEANVDRYQRNRLSPKN